MGVLVAYQRGRVVRSAIQEVMTMNIRHTLLITLLLPCTASALLCEDTGTCADSRLNQTYEIKQEIRHQGDETRREIRKERRTESYRLDKGEHRARDVLLHKKSL